MGDRVARRGRSRSAWVVLTVGVVVVALSAVLGALWSTGGLNTVICGGSCGAAAIAEPEKLKRSATVSAAAPKPEVEGSVDPGAVRSAVARPIRSRDLGRRVGVSVVDPATGEEVFRSGPDALIPASTTKLLTAAAANDSPTVNDRIETSVARSGNRLTLVGGGDPFLSLRLTKRRDPAVRADLVTLAKRTAKALRADGIKRVKLGYDATLFTGPAVSPDWEPHYVPGQIVTPISALWSDRGITRNRRTGEPAQAAAVKFASLLRRQGVEVVGRAEAGKARSDAEPIAVVRGPSLAEASESFVLTSNNEASEVIARQVALATDRPASFTGASEAVAAILAKRDVPVDSLVLQDGSGLSRGNRISPTTLASVVAKAVAGQRWPGLLEGLPVGGFSGTLADRFSGASGAGAGLVRAKTGTLTGVHSIAGYVLDARGVPLAFAVMVDRTEKLNALRTQAGIDRVAAALADCSCG